MTAYVETNITSPRNERGMMTGHFTTNRNHSITLSAIEVSQVLSHTALYVDSWYALLLNRI